MLRNLSRTRVIFIFITLVLLIGSGIIWILNAQGFIRGSWSPILAIIFVIFGVAFAFLQWALPLVPTNTSIEDFSREVELRLSKSKGGLIIYAKKKHAGREVNLLDHEIWFRDLNTRASSPNKQTKYISERRSNGQVIYVAVFRNLKPGSYVVWMDVSEPRSITINSSTVAELDFR